MNRRTWLALLIIALGASGATPSDLPKRYLDPVFGRVSVTRNLVYGESALPSGERRNLLLDLYQPEGDRAARRAAIVWIHGGGFFRGSKSDKQMSTLARNFAQRGYLTVSIDYRLERKDKNDPNLRQPIMDAMFDARAAVRWLRARAGEYKIDPARIAIGGGSAGAFTSLLIAYDAGEGTSGNSDYPSTVSAVVDFWGGLPDVKVMKTGAPPLLIIHGTADAVVPFRFAVDLSRQARAVGIPCEFHPLNGQGHAAWGKMKDYIAWIAPFLYEHVIFQNEAAINSIPFQKRP
jgi:acetyl esterase/lipase